MSDIEIVQRKYSRIGAANSWWGANFVSSFQWRILRFNDRKNTRTMNLGFWWKFLHRGKCLLTLTTEEPWWAILHKNNFQTVVKIIRGIWRLSWPAAGFVIFKRSYRVSHDEWSDLKYKQLLAFPPPLPGDMFCLISNRRKRILVEPLPSSPLQEVVRSKFL